MDVQTLDPRQYALKPASIDQADFDALVNLHFPALQQLGERLATLGVLPIEYDQTSATYRTTGNYGIRAGKGLKGFLITGSNVNKHNLHRENLLYVERINYDTATIFCHGKVQPSKEVLIHDQTYRVGPELGTIAHIHDTTALHLTTVPTTERKIICAHYQDARKVADFLRKNEYLILKDHGQVIVGCNTTALIDAAVRRHVEAVRQGYLP